MADCRQTLVICRALWALFLDRRFDFRPHSNLRHIVNGKSKMGTGSRPSQGCEVAKDTHRTGACPIFPAAEAPTPHVPTKAPSRPMHLSEARFTRISTATRRATSGDCTQSPYSAGCHSNHSLRGILTTLALMSSLAEIYPLFRDTKTIQAVFPEIADSSPENRPRNSRHFDPIPRSIRQMGTDHVDTRFL